MMRYCTVFIIFVLVFLLTACVPETATPPEIPDADTTLFGFFPSPPEATTQSIINTYKTIGEHGDVALLQQNIPWADFTENPDAESSAIVDTQNQYSLANMYGLEVIYVVDPLNGLNRREIFGLPDGWEASFKNPKIRAAFTHYTLRIVREFHPRYLGLASEINTYADAFPEDFTCFLSLYNSVYDLVKAESPDTQVFVTFQWEEMNNLIPGMTPGQPYEISWEMMEQFEPRLDIWAISSYPFAVGLAGKDIPDSYYQPLLGRTTKPVAVAEGGYNSEPVMTVTGTPQDQVDYLKAIYSQIGGPRLAFWIYLIITDLNMDSFTAAMKEAGRGDDAPTIGYFTKVGFIDAQGDAKPALAVWDSYRLRE